MPQGASSTDNDTQAPGPQLSSLRSDKVVASVAAVAHLALGPRMGLLRPADAGKIAIAAG